MKTFIIKSILFLLLLAGFTACKKEVYPEQLQFLVIDSYTKKPIENATVELIKVWQHPVKLANNASSDAWFPEYGRKHMQELQTGITDENGKVSFTQEHKKYLYIIPGVIAEGYQLPKLDTLDKFKKKNANGNIYTIPLQALIKTTFIFKSNIAGFISDSVVFSAGDKVKVMRGANINDQMEVLSLNTGDLNTKIWYAGTIHRRGKKQTLCDYVISQPNANNVFTINIDI
jgi:hypothetical protein